LFVRKKVDFNLAQQDAQSCLEEIVKVQRDIKEKYHAAGCDDVIREAAAKKRDNGTSDSH
jgi:propanediol dehydratase small subunit